MLDFSAIDGDEFATDTLYNEAFLPATLPEHAILSKHQIVQLTDGYDRAFRGIPPTDGDVDLVLWAVVRLEMVDPDTGRVPELGSEADCQDFLYRAWGSLFRGTKPDESDGLHYDAGDLWEDYVLKPVIADMVNGDLVNCCHPSGKGRAAWKRKELVVLGA